MYWRCARCEVIELINSSESTETFELLYFGRPIEKDVVSLAIQAYLRSPFSHTAIRARDRIFECHWPSVRIQDGQDAITYGDRAIAHAYLEVDPASLDKAIAWAESAVGDHYDLADLLALGLGFVAEQPKEFICSSFCAVFFEHAGLWISDDPGAETPVTLANRFTPIPFLNPIGL